MRLQDAVPFGLRVALVRLRREPEMWLVRRVCARHSSSRSFEFELASHTSPLKRKTTAYGSDLQRAKERNVALVASAIDGTVLEPYDTFSYHALVGKPSRRRGFLRGPEMQRGRLVAGLGGGACSVSNMLYLLAIMSGMKITERHRHGLDLFPDHGRTVPFACGATVFYNQADLRFENPLPVPVKVTLHVRDGALVGNVSAKQDPGFKFEILEQGHRFWKESDRTFRENTIVRRVLGPDGSLVLDEVLARNKAQVLYEVESEEPL